MLSEQPKAEHIVVVLAMLVVQLEEMVHGVSYINLLFKEE